MCGSTRVAWVGTLVSLKLSPVCFQKSVTHFSALGTGRIFPAIHIAFDWSLAVLLNLPFALFMFLLMTFTVAMTSNTAPVRPNM